MMKISISKAISDVLPDLLLAGVLMKVKTESSSETLLKQIDSELDYLSSTHDPQSIREMDTVKATKDAYRKLGKDPNRYRPAAEALLRRLANGKGLYRISNVVDILNLISTKTGFSICGYDYNQIIGDITFDIGQPNEPYVGIGRGDLNIERLPVFHDELSCFGNPTSDSVRTMVSSKTQQFLMIFIAFDDSDVLNNAIKESVNLLQQFAEGELIESFKIYASK